MEKEINFQDILKNAFLITWKNKFLWVFGFFIFLGSIVSSGDINGGNISKQSEDFSAITSFAQQRPSIFLALAGFLILIIMLLFLLRMVATSALIKSANNIPLYKQLPIKDVFLQAKKNLWRLFLLEIIIAFSMGIIVAILSAPVTYLFFLKAKLFAFLALVSAIMIAFPLLVLVYYLRKYSYFFIVLGDLGIRASFEMSYALFIKNVKVSLLMGLITLALGLLSILIFPLIVLAVIIMLSPFGIVAYILSLKTVLFIILVIGGILILTAIFTFFSWYTSFLQTSWLLFFQQISFEKTKEKKITEKQEVEGKIPSPEVV